MNKEEETDFVVPIGESRDLQSHMHGLDPLLLLEVVRGRDAPVRIVIMFLTEKDEFAIVPLQSSRLHGCGAAVVITTADLCIDCVLLLVALALEVVRGYDAPTGIVVMSLTEEDELAIAPF